MDIQKYLERIRKISKEDVESTILSLIEETGEVAKAFNVERGSKTAKLKENTPQETVDVLAIALEIFSKYEWTEEDIETYLNKKLNKWEKNVMEKQNG